LLPGMLAPTQPRSVTECPIDAFCIGDVDGEASFPPERAEEVFIAEVLERGGFDEHRIAERLHKGQPVLRP
jgi:hypothetical protein